MDRIRASSSASVFVTDLSLIPRILNIRARDKDDLWEDIPRCLTPFKELTFENGLSLSTLTSPTNGVLPCPIGPVHGLTPIPAITIDSVLVVRGNEFVIQIEIEGRG